MFCNVGTKLRSFWLCLKKGLKSDQDASKPGKPTGDKTGATHDIDLAAFVRASQPWRSSSNTDRVLFRH